jgi:hypothetical protein
MKNDIGIFIVLKIQRKTQPVNSKEMSNIFTNKGNANQNDTKMPFHPSRNGSHKTKQIKPPKYLNTIEWCYILHLVGM